MRHGALWGLGHGLTLLIFCGVLLLYDLTIPSTLAEGLELLVGVMLVFLGGNVIRRLITDQIRFRRHQHADGTVHIHAHSISAMREQQGSGEYAHSHPCGLSLKAFVVGMMHGMAGTGVLLVLATASVQSPFTGLIYIIVFGVGSITGMTVLSALMAVPMGYLERSLSWVFHSMQAAIGGITLVIGVNIIRQIGFVAGWLA